MAFNMSIDEIYEKVLKVPTNRRRLPVFEKICDPSGYITRDGYFVKDDGSVHKSYAATVIAKEGSLCPGLSGTSTLTGSSRVFDNQTVDLALYPEAVSSSYKYPSTGSSTFDLLGQYSSQLTNNESYSSNQLDKQYYMVPVQDLLQGRAITNLKEDEKNVLKFDMYTGDLGSSDTEPSIWSQPTPSHGCTFCRTNGERPEVYESHTIKDSMKRVTCPVLKGLTCTECGATGEEAHTITYCPVRLMHTNGKPISTTIALKRTKVKSNGKRRFH